MKQHYLSGLLLGCLLAGGAAQAQLVIDGTNFTNMGTVTNRDAYTLITNASGSAYSASGGAVFQHYETSADAFRVNSAYNANGTGGSTDAFSGPNGTAGTQGVSGSVAPNFSTLLLQNGSTSLFAFTNTAGANVYTAVTFQNALTTTLRNLHQAGALRFQAGATYSGGTTDAQHVDGYVSKIGNTAFTFPIGSATDLRTLALAASTDASNHISAAWFAGSPATVTDPSDNATHSVTSLTGPITGVSTVGFWDYIRVAGSGAVNVTVSIPDVTSFGTAASLRLVGWNGSSWINLSGSTGASGNTENSTLSGTIPAGTTITALAIGKAAAALPDLTVSAEIDNSEFTQPGQTNGHGYLVTLYEIKGVATSDVITFIIQRPANWSFDYPANATTINVNGGTTVDNANWTLSASGRFLTVTSKPGVSIPANGSVRIGINFFVPTALAENTTQNVTININAGTGGGETPSSNNLAVTALTFN
ncbi:hypothetical protein [Siphonobacter sp. SORGH_AS_1065]|uniref:hypothetical protein n=1 Tax=Siphonobacter sp. SORGH_AS_1065 TaxID=3041795 RepID=UPI0027880FD9|nr:hypothetical protein [Siphonobacter sp. SORGH_AS_1065]MDQ1089442.1 hypothetical protein [Siphonobacter sp. SORGH_AS_1065]